MTQGTVQLTISFETLMEAINSLSLAEKIRLWDMLEAEIAEAEDADPEVQAQIEQALADYRAGDYMTVEEYMARQQDD
jgi:hypothetical protein